MRLEHLRRRLGPLGHCGSGRRRRSASHVSAVVGSRELDDDAAAREVRARDRVAASSPPPHRRCRPARSPPPRPPPRRAARENYWATKTLARARVLSIQSHVVHGYVGNKSAVFPLQLLGVEVDLGQLGAVLQPHGVRRRRRGDVLQGDQLRALVDGLGANGLLAGHTHLLTGYIGSPSFLRAVVDALVAIRAANAPEAVAYFCDPVLGDGGKLYVPEALVEIYRDDVVLLATVRTPLSAALRSGRATALLLPPFHTGADAQPV